MLIKRIISGGQTGGDRGGLLAGVALGIETGGHCPRDWRTEDGCDISLKDFGLHMTTASGYPTRTRLNIENSHATVGFGDQNSPGMLLTYKYCREHGKPYLSVESIKSFPHEDEPYFIDWLERNNVTILNVAGNRESTNPGIEQHVATFLIEALG